MLTAVTGTADHVRRNRGAWDQWAAEYAGPGLRLWAASEPSWGIWNVAEAQAGVLPAELAGRDSIELGCGTGYVSAWLARRGARPVGLDNSAAQLATGRLRRTGDSSAGGAAHRHRMPGVARGALGGSLGSCREDRGPGVWRPNAAAGAAAPSPMLRARGCKGYGCQLLRHAVAGT